MYKKITSKTISVGIATFISRVFGFIRDIIIAILFGTSGSAQAFVVAFRLPNTLRDFVGEGAARAAIIPVLSRYLESKKQEFYAVSSSLFKIAVILLLLLSALLFISAPLLIRIVAPGFINDIAKLSLTIKLLRILSPFIFFIGLVALLSALLNSYKIFWPSALSPIILNITLILAALILSKNFGIYSLAIGILIGGAIQLALHFHQVAKLQSLSLLFQGKLFCKQLNEIFKLLYPRFLGGIVYHLNLLIDTFLSSLEFIVGTGAVAALYYAQRLIQLPLAVFAVSMATVTLPYLSKSAANSHDDFKTTFAFSLSSVSLVTLPSAVGLFVLAVPIVRVLFQHGKFDYYSTLITSQALRFYALGLFFYAGIKILVSTFYSLKDSITPVKTASFALFLNLVLSLLLMPYLKIAGLCLATSISACYNFLLLFSQLKKKIPDLESRELKAQIYKLLLPTSLMGLLLFIIKNSIFNLPLFEPLLLLIMVVLGIVIYFFLGLIFKCEGIIRIWRYLCKK